MFLLFLCLVTSKKKYFHSFQHIFELLPERGFILPFMHRDHVISSFGQPSSLPASLVTAKSQDMETKTRYYCAAEGCSADTKKIGRYGYMENITFHPFPTQKKDPKGRKMWLKLLKRKDYDPPKHHRLCSRHFVDGKPTHENPYPTLFSYNNFKEPLKSRRTHSIDKRNSTIKISKSHLLTLHVPSNRSRMVMNFM